MQWCLVNIYLLFATILLCLSAAINIEIPEYYLVDTSDNHFEEINKTDYDSNSNSTDGISWFLLLFFL
jgi:hypothetical protein